MASSSTASVTADAPGAPVRRRWWERIPHTYVILFFLMLAAAALTYILPAGEFAREKAPGVSRPVIVPGSFKEVPRNPTGFLEFFMAIPKGFLGAGQIIALILLSSAAFSVILSTGALSKAIGAVLSRLRASKVPGTVTIWIVTFLFSLLGIIVGPEIQIPFTIIGITIALGLGFDLIVGLGMILGGGYMGFNMSPINASILGTSQAVVGLPTFSGQGYRWIMWLVLTAVTALFTSWYAGRVRKDPTKSFVHGIPTDGLSVVEGDEQEPMKGRDWLVLLVVVAMFVAIVVGAANFKWYLDEMSAVFVLAGIVAGLAGGLKVSQIIDAEIKGVSNAAPVALILALARGTQVILENGKIMDTIINGLSGVIGQTGPYVAAVLITIIVAIVHFFIPSGSGLAVSIMPVIGPLGQLSGLTAQTTVLAFQLGATLPNYIYPTVGATMAMIGIARVPLDRWIRYAFPLTILAFLVSWVFLLVAVAIGY